MHYVLYKMKHNEEGYISKDFFKSFKQNFKQATKIWLIIVGVGAVVAADVYIFYKDMTDMSQLYKLAIYTVAFIIALGFVYAFPVLAHYDNTVKNTLKNAYAMAVYGFLKSIIMVAVVFAPWVAAVFVPNGILFCIFFGFTLPGYICVFLYKEAFWRFELAQKEAIEEIKAIEGIEGIEAIEEIKAIEGIEEENKENNI